MTKRKRLPKTILFFAQAVLLSLLILGCGERGFVSSASDDSSVNSKPFFEGEKTVPLKPYELPEFLEKRIKIDVDTAEESPVSRSAKEAAELSKAAKRFELEGLDFTVDLDRKKMKFKGKLSSDGKFMEIVELEGNFNPSASLWTSDDLFAVDPKVRAERRMQATAVCLDTNVCDRVAVRFYILVDGEVLSLHFEKDAVSIGEASSGHESDSAENLEDLAQNQSQSESPSEVAEDEDTSHQDLGDQSYFEGDRRYKIKSEDESLARKNENENEEESKVIEYNGPTSTPTPQVSKDSIQGIEKFSAPSSGTQRAQAIGRHNKGRLEYATTLPLDGPGFTRRDRSSSHPAYGTDLMVSLIKEAAKVTEATYPGRPPISVGHLSAKTGRKLGGHASHQNGLDADIAFPKKTSKDRSFWVPINRDSTLSSEMDKERFWKFAKGLVCSKSGRDSHVMVIFVDQRIKRQMCSYVRGLGEDLSSKNSCAYQTLRSMKHWKNHHHHIHVRAYCPGTVGCSNTNVSLPASTGC